MQPQHTTGADQVRRYVIERIVNPGRAAGMRTVTVRAGDVHRGLEWGNRVPSVCSALDAQEFQRLSRTQLLERRGPAQSTTTEWVFALSPEPDNPDPDRTPTAAGSGHRMVADWDGEVFRPVVVPPELEAGRRVVLSVTPVHSAQEMAGRFGSFVATLSEEEAAEMQSVMDAAFETISDEW